MTGWPERTAEARRGVAATLRPRRFSRPVRWSRIASDRSCSDIIDTMTVTPITTEPMKTKYSGVLNSGLSRSAIPYMPSITTRCQATVRGGRK